MRQKLRVLRNQKPRGDLSNCKIVRACAKILPGRHPSEVIEYLRLGEEMTIATVAEVLGVSYGTVQEWQSVETIGLKHITEKQRQASRANAKTMTGKNKNNGHYGRHRWRANGGINENSN